MAKPRKNYSRGKKPFWQWIIFYLIIGGIIYSLLYFSGIINIGKDKANYTSDYSSNSSDYNYVE